MSDSTYFDPNWVFLSSAFVEDIPNKTKILSLVGEFVKFRSEFRLPSLIFLDDVIQKLSFEYPINELIT